MKVLFSPCLCHFKVLIIFLNPNLVKEFKILFFLITSDIGHIFLRFVAIYVSFVKKGKCVD